MVLLLVLVRATLVSAFAVVLAAHAIVTNHLVLQRPVK